MEIVPLITSTLRERAPRAEPTYRGALRRPLHLKNRRAASDPHRATLGLGLYRIPSRVDVSNTNAQRSKTPLGPPPRTTLKSLQCRTIAQTLATNSAVFVRSRLEKKKLPLPSCSRRTCNVARKPGSSAGPRPNTTMPSTQDQTRWPRQRHDHVAPPKPLARSYTATKL